MLDLESLRSMDILGYASDIVVLLCDCGLFGQYIFAVTISDSRPSSSSGDARHPRVKLCIPVRSTNKLFVRHNDRYLVLGSHSATGSHGHHEWLLQVFSLETSEPVNAEPLQLGGFYGSEMGSTVCFTIHEGVFHAVTNQTSFESEEVDWTSYYHIVSFRLDEPNPELRIKVIWRRQHLEGPINDAWTDLGFQIDHCTGELLIVECRKEWVNGGSRSIRTYYTEPMRRADVKDVKDGLRHPPSDDRLISTLDENSNSRYEESKVRVDRFVHAEFPAINEGNTKEYIRAKTKWNGYNFNAQSFVDLVTDEVVPEGEWRPRQRIRLRVVSRQELCPLIGDERSTNSAALIIRPRLRNREDREMEDGERAFSPSQVFLWPPDDAPQDLHEILCPEGKAGDVKAALGDEGIVYMAGPPREAGSPERALVFICFDPTFGFAGMKRLDGTFAVPKHDKKRRSGDVEADVDLLSMQGGESQLSSPNLTERTKRMKFRVESDNDIAMNPEAILPADEKREPDLMVPPQGDITAQALGLDPPDAPAAAFQQSANWPPPRDSSPRSSARSTRPSRETRPDPGRPSSPAMASSIQQNMVEGKGKGRARVLPTTLTTWREKAQYLSIGRGYWLR